MSTSTKQEIVWKASYETRMAWRAFEKLMYTQRKFKGDPRTPKCWNYCMDIILKRFKVCHSSIRDYACNEIPRNQFKKGLGTGVL